VTALYSMVNSQDCKKKSSEEWVMNEIKKIRRGNNTDHKYYAAWK